VSADVPKRVFIVGCRRSGTTWTMLLLAHHPGVVALQQTDLFRRLAHVRRWLETRDAFGACALAAEVRPGVEGARTADGLVRVPLADALARVRHADLVRPLATAVYAELAALHPAPLALVEQTPEHLEVWEDVLAVFPDAWFVHVVRDPRSVYGSQRDAAVSWADPTRFSRDPLDVAEEWVRAVERGRAIAAATPRYHEVRYESLRRDPARTLAALLRALELPADDALCARAVSACALETLRTSAHAPPGFFRRGEADGWRSELSRSALRAVEHVAGPLMRELGYEPLHPADAPAPLRVRWRRTRRAAGAALRRWAWESRSPLRTGAARALRRLPFARALALRRLARPERDAA
jgi:hypothetical protein